MEPTSREDVARGAVGDIAEVLGHRMADSTPVNWLEVAVQANQAAALALAQLERHRLGGSSTRGSATRGDKP